MFPLIVLLKKKSFLKYMNHVAFVSSVALNYCACPDESCSVVGIYSMNSFSFCLISFRLIPLVPVSLLKWPFWSTVFKHEQAAAAAAELTKLYQAFETKASDMFNCC